MNQEQKGGAAGDVEHLTAQPIERRAGWTSASPAPSAKQEPKPRTATRDQLYAAVIDCHHSIDADRIVLYRETGKEGNALSQLSDRLDAIAREASVPPAVRAAVDRMCMPLDKAFISGATAEADAQCMATIKGFIDGLDAAPSASASPASPEAQAPLGWVQFIDGAQTDVFVRDEQELAALQQRLRGIAGHKNFRYVPVVAAPVVQPFPERDQSKPAEQQGLFRKFDVRRVDGSDQPGGKHYGCRYYVLDLNHDQHAPAAMRAYAASCRATHLHLADDIEAEFGAASVAGSQQVPEAQIVKAGRALADRHADVCNIDKEDTWKLYGNDFIEEARFVIEAIAAAPAVPVPVEQEVWIAFNNADDDEPVMFFTELPGKELKDRFVLKRYLCREVAAPSLQQGKEGSQP